MQVNSSGDLPSCKAARQTSTTFMNTKANNFLLYTTQIPKNKFIFFNILTNCWKLNSLGVILSHPLLRVNSTCYSLLNWPISVLKKVLFTDVVYTNDSNLKCAAFQSLTQLPTTAYMCLPFAHSLCYSRALISLLG